MATLSCSPADRETFVVAVRCSLKQKPAEDDMLGGCMRSMAYMASATLLVDEKPTVTNADV
jgi:hypothetical protein